MKSKSVVLANDSRFWVVVGALTSVLSRFPVPNVFVTLDDLDVGSNDETSIDGRP